MAAVTLGDGKYSFSGRTQDTSLPVLLFYVSSQAHSLLTTNSQSMVSLNNNNNQEISKFASKQEMKTTTSEVCLHEVEEKRGFTPSEVAKDPVKRDFLSNLSKRIFSPSDAITTRLSRQKQVSRSFRVRRVKILKSHNIPET